MSRRVAGAVKPATRPTAGSRAAALSVHTRAGPNGRAAGEDEVRLRAYLKWEAAGRPDGDGREFWFEAERELRAGG